MKAAVKYLEYVVAAVHKADAVGKSGLLVKSTVVMRENLEERSRQGLDLPVMLGGAALTRRYVEEDCAKAYAAGRVAYARDAFAGLHLIRFVRFRFGGFPDSRENLPKRCCGLGSSRAHRS